MHDKDPQGAQVIWDRYAESMRRLARFKLRNSPQRLEDEDDVVARAFVSLFRRAEAAPIADRKQLKGLLVTIVDRKVCRVLRDQGRLKRKGEGESALDAGDSTSGGFANLAGGEPTPEIAAMWQESIAALLGRLDERQQQVAFFKLEGLTDKEVAERMGVSRATIERWLSAIRKLWQTWEEEQGTD